jgi:hypothetical protein
LKRLPAVVIPLLIAALAFELAFVPIDRVLASPPNQPLTSCATAGGAPPGTTVPDALCTFRAAYYLGGGSVTYCFLGEGALYLEGVYYPLTQPGASLAREVDNPYCPAMHQ